MGNEVSAMEGANASKTNLNSTIGNGHTSIGTSQLKANTTGTGSQNQIGLGNFGLGNLSNIGSNITNTMTNLSSQGTGLLKNQGVNLTSLGGNLSSNIASNLSNLGGNLASNLSGSLIDSNTNDTKMNTINKMSNNLNSTSNSLIHKQSQQSSKFSNSDIPDVDLSGLTEEEKNMIQNVMMRAQESEANSNYVSNSNVNRPETNLTNQIENSRLSSNQQDQNIHNQNHIINQNFQQKDQLNLHQQTQMNMQLQTNQNETTNSINDYDKMMGQESHYFNQMQNSYNEQLQQQQQQNSQIMNQDLNQQKRKSNDVFCPICRISILLPSNELECKCHDCNQIVCKNCGIKSENQFDEKIWLCVDCNKKYKQSRLMQNDQQIMNGLNEMQPNQLNQFQAMQMSEQIDLIQNQQFHQNQINQNSIEQNLINDDNNYNSMKCDIGSQMHQNKNYSQANQLSNMQKPTDQMIDTIEQNLNQQNLSQQNLNQQNLNQQNLNQQNLNHQNFSQQNSNLENLNNFDKELANQNMILNRIDNKTQQFDALTSQNLNQLNLSQQQLDLNLNLNCQIDNLNNNMMGNQLTDMNLAFDNKDVFGNSNLNQLEKKQIAINETNLVNNSLLTNNVQSQSQLEINNNILTNDQNKIMMNSMKSPNQQALNENSTDIQFTSQYLPSNLMQNPASTSEANYYQNSMQKKMVDLKMNYSNSNVNQILPNSSFNQQNENWSNQNSKQLVKNDENSYWQFTEEDSEDKKNIQLDVEHDLQLVDTEKKNSISINKDLNKDLIESNLNSNLNNCGEIQSNKSNIDLDEKNNLDFNDELNFVKLNSNNLGDVYTIPEETEEEDLSTASTQTLRNNDLTSDLQTSSYTKLTSKLKDDNLYGNHSTCDLELLDLNKSKLIDLNAKTNQQQYSNLMPLSNQNQTNLNQIPQPQMQIPSQVQNFSQTQQQVHLQQPPMQPNQLVNYTTNQDINDTVNQLFSTSQSQFDQVQQIQQQSLSSFTLPTIPVQSHQILKNPQTHQFSVLQQPNLLQQQNQLQQHNTLQQQNLLQKNLIQQQNQPIQQSSISQPYLINSSMSTNTNALQSALSQPQKIVQAVSHTSHFSPQFQRKMPQIRPEMISYAKYKNKNLSDQHHRPTYYQQYSLQSPYDSPTSVSSSSSVLDTCHATKCSSRYTEDRPSASSLHRSPKHITYANKNEYDLSYQYPCKKSDHTFENVEKHDKQDRHYYHQSPHRSPYHSPQTTPHRSPYHSPHHSSRHVSTIVCNKCKPSSSCVCCENKSKNHDSPKHSSHHNTLHHNKNSIEKKPCSIHAPETAISLHHHSLSKKLTHNQAFNSIHQQSEKILNNQEHLINDMKQYQKRKINEMANWSSASSPQSSPLLDVSPLLDAIIDQNPKSKKQISNKDKIEYEIQKNQLPRVKSGALTAIIDDSNKAKTKKPTSNNMTYEMNYIEPNSRLKSKEELKRLSRRYSLDSKMETNLQSKDKLLVDEKIENKSKFLSSNLISVKEETSKIAPATVSVKDLNSKNALTVQPIKKTLEKIVSPVIDQTMHQQQLLINQQQQLILLQKEQNKLQQQLQEQLKKQQDTQIAREIRLEKEQRLLELQKQQQAQLIELEHQELKLKHQKQLQQQQQQIHRGHLHQQQQIRQAKQQQVLQQQQIEAAQELQRQQELQQQQIRQQQQQIQQQQQQNLILQQQTEQKKEELRNLGLIQPQVSVISAAVIPPVITGPILPTSIIQPNEITTIDANQMISSQPIIQSQLQSIHQLPTIPQITSSNLSLPAIPTNAPVMTATRALRPLKNALSLGNTLTSSRKDRRRLPQPTVEEIEQANIAIGLNNRLSGLSIQQQQQQLLSDGSIRQVLHTQLSLPELTTPPFSTSSIVHNIKNSVSLAGSKIVTSKPINTIASISNITTTTTLTTNSGPKSTKSSLAKSKENLFSVVDNISDTQSETSWRNKRKVLPKEPKNELPVTMKSLNRASKETNNLPQRPSSSLEFTENDQALKNTMLNSILSNSNKSLNRNLTKLLGNYLSPYSSLSDIANLINQSSAVTLGRLSPAIIASTHANKLGTVDTLNKNSNPLLKTVRQQLKEELRNAVNERKRLIKLRNQSDTNKIVAPFKSSLTNAFFGPSTGQLPNSKLVKGRSESDLRTLIDGTTASVNLKKLSQRLIESAEDRINREQRTARIKAEIERRKLHRIKRDKYLPSNSREALNLNKSSDLLNSELLANTNILENELIKEAQLANIEHLEQKILENELMNEELANQDLMQQHIRNMKILGQYDNFTGTYMPNARFNKNTSADDYFGAKKHKILARQMQLNKTYPEYSHDDLYINHHYPYYHQNNLPRYNQMIQTGGLGKRSIYNLHQANCLNNSQYTYRSGNMFNDLTPAMPILSDVPSKSRKLIENLTNPMPIVKTANSLYDASNLNQRLMPTSKPKYMFPVKRVLLTRESKERTAINNGNPFGVQIIGGQQISGTNMLGAFVVKVFPGGVMETLGEVREGDQVLEWNGIPLTGLKNNEVKQIMMNSFGSEEVEITIRDDNVTYPDYLMRANSIDPIQQQATYLQQPQSQMLTGTQLVAPQVVTTGPLISSAPVLTIPQIMPQLTTLGTTTFVPNAYLTQPEIQRTQQLPGFINNPNYGQMKIQQFVQPYNLPQTSQINQQNYKPIMTSSQFNQQIRPINQITQRNLNMGETDNVRY